MTLKGIEHKLRSVTTAKAQRKGVMKHGVLLHVVSFMRARRQSLSKLDKSLQLAQAFYPQCL